MVDRKAGEAASYAYHFPGGGRIIGVSHGQVGHLPAFGVQHIVVIEIRVRSRLIAAVHLDLLRPDFHVDHDVAVAHHIGREVGLHVEYVLGAAEQVRRGGILQVESQQVDVLADVKDVVAYREARTPGDFQEGKRHGLVVVRVIDDVEAFLFIQHEQQIAVYIEGGGLTDALGVHEAEAVVAPLRSG